jgi:hypothetical protein
MAANKFRPQDMPKRWTMKMRRKGYDNSFESYNFQTRVEWYPAAYGPNKINLSRIFGRLHYLACHSPKKVAIKYKVAYNNFENKHFARKGKASMRYLNAWTALSWL